MKIIIISILLTISYSSLCNDCITCTKSNSLNTFDQDIHLDKYFLILMSKDHPKVLDEMLKKNAKDFYTIIAKESKPSDPFQFKRENGSVATTTKVEYLGIECRKVVVEFAKPEEKPLVKYFCSKKSN